MFMIAGLHPGPNDATTLIPITAVPPHQDRADADAAGIEWFETTGRQQGYVGVRVIGDDTPHDA